jgi:hypothetical protein
VERWWGSSPQSLASTFNAWLVLASPDGVADKCQSYHWDLALPLDGRRADTMCANEGGHFFDCLVGEDITIWTEISGVITWGQLHQILLKHSSFTSSSSSFPTCKTASEDKIAFSPATEFLLLLRSRQYQPLNMKTTDVVEEKLTCYGRGGMGNYR